MNSDNKNKVTNVLQLRMVTLLNILLMTSAFAFVWYGYYADRIDMPYYRRGNWLIVFIFFLLYLSLGLTYDSFMVSYYRISEMIYSQILAVLVTDVILGSM